MSYPKATVLIGGQITAEAAADLIRESEVEIDISDIDEAVEQRQPLRATGSCRNGAMPSLESIVKKYGLVLHAITESTDGYDGDERFIAGDLDMYWSHNSDGERVLTFNEISEFFDKEKYARDAFENMRAFMRTAVSVPALSRESDNKSPKNTKKKP